MPYNSYFPVGYQPMQYYPQQYAPQPQQVQNVPQMQQPQIQNGQQQPQQVNPTMTSGIIWVQGEAGAKSYLVAPNTTVQLWDSERQTIYLKSADASGMPSIKTLDYTIREMPQNNVSLTPNFDSKAFATREEVNALAEQINALKSDLDGFSKKSAGRPKKEVTENE